MFGGGNGNGGSGNGNGFQMAMEPSQEMTDSDRVISNWRPESGMRPQGQAPQQGHFAPAQFQNQAPAQQFQPQQGQPGLQFQVQPNGQTYTQSPQQQMVAMSPQQLTQLAQSIGRVAAPPQPTQPRMTEEEFRRTTGYPTVNQQHVGQLWGDTATEQTRMTAFQQLMDQVVKHIYQVNGMALQNVQNTWETKFTNELSPLQEMVRQQHSSALADHVVQSYPVLQTYQHVVPQVIASLRAQGYRPTDGQEAIRTVAAQAEQFIRGLIPQFSLQPQQQVQQAQSRSAMPQMASMIQGGQNGASQARQGGNKPAWASVFGD